MEIKVEYEGTEMRIAQTENELMYTIQRGNDMLATPITYDAMRELMSAIGFIMQHQPYNDAIMEGEPAARGLQGGAIRLGSGPGF